MQFIAKEDHPIPVPVLVEYLFIPSASSYLRRIIPCLSPGRGELLLSILTLSQQQDHRIGEPLDPLQSQLPVDSTKNRLCLLWCFLLCRILPPKRRDLRSRSLGTLLPPLPMSGESSLAHPLRPD